MNFLWLRLLHLFYLTRSVIPNVSIVLRLVPFRSKLRNFVDNVAKWFGVDHLFIDNVTKWFGVDLVFIGDVAKGLGLDSVKVGEYRNTTLYNKEQI